MSTAVAERIGRIKNRGGIRGRELAQLLDTTPETISRWNTGRVGPQPDRLQRLLNLEWILDELSELFAPDQARLWLFSPHRMLQGERPADLIQRDETDKVLTVIDAMREGAFT
jgi:transcriptional regulator with XRE-family HTH domain